MSVATLPALFQGLSLAFTAFTSERAQKLDGEVLHKLFFCLSGAREAKMVPAAPGDAKAINVKISCIQNL